MGETAQIIVFGEQDHLIHNEQSLLPRESSGTSIADLGIDAAKLQENRLIEYTGWNKTDKMASIAEVALLGIFRKNPNMKKQMPR